MQKLIIKRFATSCCITSN